MSDHTKSNSTSRDAKRGITNLTAEDLAFLEKHCLRIMGETTDSNVLGKAAEFLSTIRFQQSSARAF